MSTLPRPSLLSYHATLFVGCLVIGMPHLYALRRSYQNEDFYLIRYDLKGESRISVFNPIFQQKTYKNCYVHASCTKSMLHHALLAQEGQEGQEKVFELLIEPPMGATLIVYTDDSSCWPHESLAEYAAQKGKDDPEKGHVFLEEDESTCIVIPNNGGMCVTPRTLGLYNRPLEIERRAVIIVGVIVLLGILIGFSWYTKQAKHKKVYLRTQRKPAAWKAITKGGVES